MEVYLHAINPLYWQWYARSRHGFAVEAFSRWSI